MLYKLIAEYLRSGKDPADILIEVSRGFEESLPDNQSKLTDEEEKRRKVCIELYEVRNRYWPLYVRLTTRKR